MREVLGVYLRPVSTLAIIFHTPELTVPSHDTVEQNFLAFAFDSTWRAWRVRLAETVSFFGERLTIINRNALDCLIRIAVARYPVIKWANV